MKFYEFRPFKKHLSIRRRHLGLSALDRIQLRDLKQKIVSITKVYKYMKRNKDKYTNQLSKLTKLLNLHIEKYYAWIKAPNSLNQPLPKILSRNRTINSFEDEEIPLYFRFANKDQLRALLKCFRFPTKKFVSASGHAFHREEVLLVSLYRLHAPTTLSDATYQHVFGLSTSRVSMCFNAFLKFMVINWSYLLLDNMAYWKPHLPSCAEAIRVKLGSLGCEFPSATAPNGFNVFGFIDNTMNATCRPGGGPARDGVDAPRNDPLIQRAWYNGWKKLHGMKWQTIDLPNGMNFHVYGPVSVRHNDLYTLFYSEVNDKLAALQAGEELQYVVYGDSAYIVVIDTHIKARHFDEPNSDRQVLENRTLSSCRECIEWDYGDVSTMWAMTDFKKMLKIRKMPVSDIYLCAMLLRNAYNTMNGSNTALYFNLQPPTLEDWTSAGPRRTTQQAHVPI